MAKQPVEVQAESVDVVGRCDSESYPLQPKYHSKEYLRDIPHLRPRQRMFAAALRVRSATSHAIHSFFEVSPCHSRCCQVFLTLWCVLWIERGIYADPYTHSDLA